MSTLIKSNNKWLKVAGGGVLPVVRKPAWSQAVAISTADLVAGYTAPADGVFVMHGTYPNNAGVGYITLNERNVGTGFYPGTGSDVRPFNFDIPVSKNDIVKATVALRGNTDSVIQFVPFEDSTIAEPEVVTPEYIRNQNILSDYEAVTLPSSSASAITIPYDGYITLSYAAAVANGQVSVFCIRNGVTVKLFSGANPATQALAGTFPVQKNDKVYVDLSNAGSLHGTQYAQYYKLRDYRGR